MFELCLGPPESLEKLQALLTMDEFCQDACAQSPLGLCHLSHSWGPQTALAVSDMSPHLPLWGNDRGRRGQRLGRTCPDVPQVLVGSGT